MTTEQYRKRSGFSIFLSFFKPHRGLFFLDMACALVVSMIDLAYPIISRYAMRTLLPQSAYRTFFTIMLIVLAAYALRSVLYFIITYWGHTFGIRVEADIRAALFGHMQELGFEFFDRNRTGQLMSRMTTDLFEITELAHHGPEDLFISLVTIVGALTVMATIEWRLALVVAVMIPVFIAIIVSRRKAMREASRRVKKKTGAINADIESALSGIRTAKAFANEHVEEEKFDRSNDIYKTSKKMFHREMGIFMAVMEFFTSSLSVAVVTVGGLLIMKGQMDTVDLLTFTLYIASFVNPIRKLANFTELFSNGTAGFERFLEIMRTAPELHDAPDALELTHVRGEIGVENVSFSYEDDPEVLHDVSLHVPAGKTVAIVGPSGGGKSTLCQLIPRFYDVTGGSITVDGHDVRSVTQESLRRSIGIVQQDVFLFADSILENIRYGKPGATMEEIVEAAKRAEIYDDIMAMPDGFDTYVGERGTLLSGGQKQRISIARIFLKNPPILILDEATSALDTLTEAKIQHAFDELAKNRTTLIIAHRLSTIRAAGEIVVIADGRIAERIGGNVHAGHGNRTGALADQRGQATAGHFAHEQHIRPAIAQGQFHHAEFAAHCGQNREAHRLADGGGQAGTKNSEVQHEDKQRREQEIQQCARNQPDHAERRLPLVSQQSVECERTAYTGCGDQQRRQVLHGVWGDCRGRSQHDDQRPQGQQSDCGNHQTREHRTREAHGQ